MQNLNDHQHEQKSVNCNDERIRIGIRLHRVQQQTRGADNTQNCRQREQQAEQNIGNNFDLVKNAVG